jgi:hypothetical protein
MKRLPKRKHLKLVDETDDPAYRAAVAIFRPLVEGKRGQATKVRPIAARPKPQGRATFFMMEHDLLTALGRSLGYPALVLACEIDRLVFTTRKNPIRLTNVVLRQLGLTRQGKFRVLRRLQRIGAVEITSHGNQAPWVTWNNPARPAKASSDS